MKTEITATTIIFIAMALIYAILALVASGMQAGFAQTLLVDTGSAIFGAGLIFFLLRMFQSKGN
ncbi:MAG: hypothetical protein JSV61_10070 [Anaerolineales bacterium]|nr:MAG: hypothetical protein JSV61_10070 [Anaerolineales bacterium]